MKTLSHTFLLASTLICIALSPVQIFPRQKSEADDQLRGALRVNGLDIRRSTAQPLRRYDGERLVLTTSVGNTMREKFYGVMLILKYEVKQAERGRHRLFTEKNYLVEENYDFNVFKYFERSWRPDENGVWSDVLGIGDDAPLPADYRRVIRQELFCDGVLFSRALVVFTPTNIEFLPQPLSVEEDGRARRAARLPRARPEGGRCRGAAARRRARGGLIHKKNNWTIGRDI